jgi:hypothetical protein
LLLVPIANTKHTNAESKMPEIDWDEAAQKGAEALAQAAGTAVGGALGGAAAKLILGVVSPDPMVTWQNQVNIKLEEIKQRLDWLINFMEVKLPELIKTGATEALKEHDRKDINSVSDLINATIGGYDKEPAPNEASLRDLAGAAARLGLTLAQYGPGGYTGIILAYTLVVSAYTRLMKVDHSAAAVLAGLSASFLQRVQGWTGTELPSFPASRASMEAVVADSYPIVSHFPCMFIVGLNASVATSDVFAMPGWLSPDGTGNWNGDIASGNEILVDTRVTIEELEKAIEAVHEVRPDWKLIPFGPPLTLYGNRRSWETRFDTIRTLTRNAQNRINDAPQLRAELDKANGAMTLMIKAASMFATLSADEPGKTGYNLHLQ